MTTITKQPTPTPTIKQPNIPKIWFDKDLQRAVTDISSELDAIREPVRNTMREIGKIMRGNLSDPLSRAEFLKLNIFEPHGLDQLFDVQDEAVGTPVSHGTAIIALTSLKKGLDVDLTPDLAESVAKIRLHDTVSALFPHKTQYAAELKRHLTGDGLTRGQETYVDRQVQRIIQTSTSHPLLTWSVRSEAMGVMLKSVEKHKKQDVVAGALPQFTFS